MKEVEAARRTEILETIGKFIDEGQKLDDYLIVRPVCYLRQ